MTVEAVRVRPSWLALREPADAAARARDLVEELRRHLPATGSLAVHDLGCGTGAMARWLAPQLPGPQRWIEHDRDPELLEIAAADSPGPSADGATVTVETRRTDVTRLQPDELAGAGLVTASALLDMLTEDELARLARVCVAAACPALLTLTVTGQVELAPEDPLDRRVAAAFDDHQHRLTDRGRLLGPDAVAVTAAELGRLGARVRARPSPWRLGADEAELAAEWFAGWIGAACEQQPELSAEAGEYRRRRQAEAGAGRLGVTVEHADLLVLPPRAAQPADRPSSVCAPLVAFVAR